MKLGTNTDLTDFKILHLTGSGHCKLDTNDWIQLHSFVANGGTLIIDAAGGSQTFSDDIRSQLQTTFFDDAARNRDATALACVAPPRSGAGLTKSGYRNFARHVLAENLKVPRIRGIKSGDHIGVFFSAEDISAGLVGEPVDGIVGYDPDSATALMEHMILYAESGGRPTTTALTSAGGEGRERDCRGSIASVTTTWLSFFCSLRRRHVCAARTDRLWMAALLALGLSSWMPGIAT